MNLPGDSVVTSKITGVDAKAVRVAPSASAPRRDQTAGKAASNPGPGTDVQLTGAARSLAAMEQSLVAMPAVDEARVAAVKRRLDSGEYRIDAQRIADKLLHLESDLARRSPVENDLK
ncbi:MAG: flagellar biosynthesis anti-sigma factor FlgM [Pseudomonadota bacterium]